MPKPIFEWTIPDDHPNFTGHDDLPLAYRVFEFDDASGGIIVEALWDDSGIWSANPWSTRALIRHLLELLKAQEV